MTELPYLINYPLHMHNQYPSERKVSTLNDLITGRYDTLFQDPGWQEAIPIREPLKSWLGGYVFTT
jgi:hypothetical protein